MYITCRIKVKDLRFFSYHGFYPEEQILGNEYFVSIEVVTPLAPKIEDTLENTINYEMLYAIATEEMAISQKLLETVAENILTKIHSTNTRLEQIEVRICKVNPPFGGDKAKSEVTLNWLRQS